MAGNQSDARRQAEAAYKNALNSGVKGKTLATLKANLDAARAKELSAIGQSEQVGYGLNDRRC